MRSIRAHKNRKRTVLSIQSKCLKFLTWKELYGCLTITLNSEVPTIPKATITA